MAGAGFEIQQMTEEDLPEVVRLEKLSFVDPWSPGAFRSEVRRARLGGYARVLRTGGAILAYMIAWFVADEAHLANIAVAPEARRRGLARALLRELLIESRRRGARMVWLEVRESNEGARRLYEDFGFVAVAVRKNYYTRQREDAIVMMRALEDEGGGDRALVQ